MFATFLGRYGENLFTVYVDALFTIHCTMYINDSVCLQLFEGNIEYSVLAVEVIN